MDNIQDAMAEIAAEAKLKSPIVIYPNRDGQCLEIFLEDVPHYHDWIKGEGGDISLIRAMEDDRIIGAVLPMYKWDNRIINSV